MDGLLNVISYLKILIKFNNEQVIFKTLTGNVLGIFK